MIKIHYRASYYIITVTGLVLINVFLSDFNWQSSVHLHTLIESIATVLPLMAGCIALMNYYSGKDDRFLILGVGFLGAGFLDGYHMTVTSIWFKDYLPSNLSSLLPWTWFSSRLYLAVMFYYSYLVWHKKNILGNTITVNSRIIYYLTSFYIVFCILFFSFFRLSSAYFFEPPFHRPQELIPALIFLTTLTGYLRKGGWRDNIFDHWLILALIFNIASHTELMFFSGQLFDLPFDLAYLFKNISYFCVLVGLFLNMQDAFNQAQNEIDQSKSNKIALSNSEVRYRSIIDTVLEGIITIDERGLVASMNPAAEKTFGFKEGEVIGKNIKMLMPEPYQSEHDGYLQNYMTSGIAKIIGIGREVEGKRKNGTVFPMELAVSSMEIDGKRMFSGVVRDITERKNFEMALTNNKTRLHAVIDAVLEGIITIDEKGIVATMNPAAENIFGYDKMEVIGHNIKMLMPEPYYSKHDGYLYNYMTTGFAKIIGTGREVQGLRKNGEIFPMALSVSEIQIDNKRMFIGLVRDITERKKIDRMKNEFISTVSHELRTPLTSIQGALELILSGTLGEIPENCIPLLDIASNNSARLVRLINDILDIEKIESGMMEFAIKPVDIMAAVQDSVAENETFGNQFGVKFIITSQVKSCFVMADSDRIMQVLTNLLSNATKFSPPNQSVEVGVKVYNNKIRISVTDFGLGIADEFKDRIFNKFSQADASSTRQQGGTGLGLSICKAIVEKFNGKIDYDSVPNEKTCFYFELPVYSTEEQTAEFTHHSGKDDVILICEDDPDVAHLLKLMLEKKNYIVDIALSAEQAKEKLSTQHYAAITLDLMLPGQSGTEFFKELRSNKENSDTPVIIISAFTEKGKMNLNGDAVAVCEWLDKPIDQNRLELAISQALEEKSKNYFRILHVEDDPDIVTLVNTLLKNQATVEVASNMQIAELKLQQDYDLIILDLMLPDGNGSDLLPIIAHRNPPIPVVVFSAMDKTDELQDKVSANLIKSKTSNQDLIQSIERILKKKTKSTQE